MLKYMLPLFLCAALLLSSCTVEPIFPETTEAESGSGTDTSSIPSEKNPGFVIEDVFEAYTEENYTALSARLTELFRRAVYLSRRIALSDEQQSALREDLLTRRLPAAEARKLPAATLGELLTEAETALTAWEASDQDNAPSAADILQSFFAKALQLLGAEDAGALAYDNVVFFLDDSIRHADETFEKTGYTVYQNQADGYRALRTELTEEVGAPVFADICAAMFFGDTLLSRLLSEADAESLDTLTDAEQVLLLQKQAEGLLENEITARRWQICMRVFDRIADKTDLLDGNLTSLQSGVLNACLSDAYLDAAGGSMPALITYYAGLVRSMSADDLHALKSNDKNMRSAALCELLLRDEDSFRETVGQLSAALASQSEAEKKKLNRYWSTYLAYAEGIPAVDLDALINAMRNHQSTHTDETRMALSDTVEAYLFGVVPYVTFAFFS